MVEFGFYGDDRFSGDFNDGIRQEPLPMDIIRNSEADLPSAEDGIEPIVPGPARKREAAEPASRDVTAAGTDTPALPETDVESAQDRTEVPTLEFVRFNDPDNRSHSQQTASTLDFLSRTVLGEKYDMNFEPDERVPLLYGIIEEGRLVAAGSLQNDYTGEGVYGSRPIGRSPRPAQ